MTARRGVRRRAAGLLILAALAGGGCATEREKQAQEQQAVPRPEWRVGDQWVFQRTTLSGTPIVVTHQVVAAAPEGYTVRVLGLAQEATRRWTAELHLAQETLGGAATARYDPPAAYFAWPLAPAQTWSQEFQYADGQNDGRYANTWRVGATIEPIDTVAGRFYTLRIERWSGAQRLEAYWYNARVRYWVRLEDYRRGYAEQLMEVRAWGP